MLEKNKHIDKLFSDYLSDYEEKVPDHVWQNIQSDLKKAELMRKENVDELFSNYLSDYEEKVPNYVWQNIQSDLKNAKIRKRNSIIRAMAAAVALLITFGLGYYSSDLTKKQNYSANDLYIKPNLSDNYNKIETDNNNQQANDQLSNITQSNSLEPNHSNLLSGESSMNEGLLFKLFFRSKDDSLRIANSQDKNSLNNDKNLKNETTNQLLIDTLLFKKENLSERGFLLVERKDNQSKWSFGTKFSPVYSMAENIKQPEIKENTGILKSAKNSDRPDTKADEKSLMSFSGGVNVDYHFAKRWSIESGLFYSQYRQMADNLVGSSIEGLQDEMMVYTPEGIRYIQPNGVTNAKTSQVIGTAQDETYYSLDMDYVSNFEYIELPLIVRYKIIDQRFGLDILSGVSTNFLIGNKSTLIFNDNDLWSGSSEGISPLLYNATIGLGLNYDLFQNLSLNIEPTFKYSINPSESALLRYPYSFALFAGFSFRF